MEKAPVARRLCDTAQGSDRPAGEQPLSQRAPHGHFLLRRLCVAGLFVENQVRQRHRLAELLGRTPQCRAQPHRFDAGLRARRRALPSLWRASRPCLRRWTKTHRQAALHQRHGTDVYAGPRLAEIVGVGLKFQHFLWCRNDVHRDAIFVCIGFGGVERGE